MVVEGLAGMLGAMAGVVSEVAIGLGSEAHPDSKATVEALKLARKNEADNKDVNFFIRKSTLSASKRKRDLNSEMIYEYRTNSGLRPEKEVRVSTTFRKNPKPRTGGFPRNELLASHAQLPLG